MVTTTLNAMHQTRHLGGRVSTGVYDDGELEALLEVTNSDRRPEVRGTQMLSPELFAHILSSDFRSSQQDETNNGMK